MSIAIAATRDRATDRRVIALWLFVIAALVFVMVAVGGITRLTDSGLSIVEWKPVTGILPPMSEAAWTAEFEKYKAFPEYQKINRGMELEGFKSIYWPEYWHRVLGRLIGFAFAVPFAVFFLTGRIERALVPRLLLLFVLGGAQGALGWFMVKSGLVDRPDVSQYRLTAHLGLAVLLYWLILKAALQLWRPASPVPAPRGLAQAGLGLVYLQILLGGLVAGLDAGMIYNTWPLMDGSVVPTHLIFSETPLWLNFFENVATVQFQHRLGAYIVTLVLLLLWWRSRTTALAGTAHLVLAALALQMVLGVTTLLHVVPLPLAALHQLGALLLLSTLIVYTNRAAK